MATKWFVPASPPSIPYEDSFVYFVRNRSADQIKIGRSTDPTVRIRQLETQSGLEFETLLVLPETSELYERRLHSEAEAYRKQGTEWFEASPAMFAWIERLRRYGDDEAALRLVTFPELEEVSV
jgi:T5orf172 domain.